MFASRWASCGKAEMRGDLNMRKAIVQIDSFTLDVSLGDGFIEVDEIEGMGAMAYVFK